MTTKTFIITIKGDVTAEEIKYNLLVSSKFKIEDITVTPVEEEVKEK